MTKDREHSDLRQGDLVVKGGLRLRISGRTHLLGHLQDKTELPRRLDIEGSASTYLREALAKICRGSIGAVDGTDDLKPSWSDDPTRARSGFARHCGAGEPTSAAYWDAGIFFGTHAWGDEKGREDAGSLAGHEHEPDDEGAQVDRVLSDRDQHFRARSRGARAPRAAS